MKNNFMKKVILFCLLIPALLLTSCRQNKEYAGDGVIFKDKRAALKYRKYDFSKIKL